MPVPGQVADNGPQIGRRVVTEPCRLGDQPGERLLGDVLRIVRSQQPASRTISRYRTRNTSSTCAAFISAWEANPASALIM